MRILITLLTAGLALQPALFGRRATLDVGPGSGEILIADVNGDGHTDLVTKHLLQQRITVSLGNGAGDFRRGTGSIELPYGPGAVAAGDANGDGVPDLALASRRDGVEYAAVHPGDGRGGFIKSRDHRVHAAMQYYKPVVQLIDVNEDGAQDLVVENARRNLIHILNGDGRGGFGAPRAIAFDAGGDGYSFAFADVDADGHLDLVSTMSTEFRGGTGIVSIRSGDGRGSFRKVSTLPIESPSIALVTDLDGDGRPDILIRHASAKLSILKNQGRGVFAGTGERLPLPAETHSVVAGDLNGDGRADLAASTGHHVEVAR